MALIETEGLGQEFNRLPILKGINLRIERGEVFVLIGPTGAGKTTLLRLLDLIDRPAHGRIIFDGTDVSHSRRERLAARRRMAYVQQKPIVLSMSVFDNVACGLRFRHEDRRTLRRKVGETLELVGMIDYQDRDARTLSGGEMQRVAIARALVTDPEVLLLDEPTANLDPLSVAKIEGVIGEIIEGKLITIVMATHDMVQGQRMATRIGVLIGGELLQSGPADEVFRSPKDDRVAAFVGTKSPH